MCAEKRTWAAPVRCGDSATAAAASAATMATAVTTRWGVLPPALVDRPSGLSWPSSDPSLPGTRR